jgi:lipopolysaccharide transport system ATP-binding protein
MSQDTVIAFENVGKRYSLAHKLGSDKYTTFRDVIARNAAAPFRAISRRLNRSNDQVSSGSREAREDFWALRGVSFEISKGDVVGIIGRNGAGKSTLLKILSRITEPTEGRIRLKGRVASLLEVGTGFHPELTGRENIYLNGSILGMKRSEIRAKFDEIVAFAEVEKFLDTPVKRFSSGMYVRLAFAVAAHLEPEILIVDEVLAVGDATFQKKCLGKLQDVAGQEGRTVLFVSHNLDSMLRLCSRVVWLNAGSVKEIGRPAAVIQAYSQHRTAESREVSVAERPRLSWLRQKALVQNVVCLADGDTLWTYQFGSVIQFSSELVVLAPLASLHFAYAIFSPSGFEIASARTPLESEAGFFPPGRYRVFVSIPEFRLTPGQYSMNFGLKSDFGDEDFVSEVAEFEIVTNEKCAELFADSINAAVIPATHCTVEEILEPTNELCAVPAS